MRQAAYFVSDAHLPLRPNAATTALGSPMPGTGKARARLTGRSRSQAGCNRFEMGLCARVQQRTRHVQRTAAAGKSTIRLCTARTANIAIWDLLATLGSQPDGHTRKRQDKRKHTTDYRAYTPDSPGTHTRFLTQPICYRQEYLLPRERDLYGASCREPLS